MKFKKSSWITPQGLQKTIDDNLHSSCVYFSRSRIDFLFGEQEVRGKTNSWGNYYSQIFWSFFWREIGDWNCFDVFWDALLFPSFAFCHSFLFEKLIYCFIVIFPGNMNWKWVLEWFLRNSLLFPFPFIDYFSGRGTNGSVADHQVGIQFNRWITGTLEDISSNNMKVTSIIQWQIFMTEALFVRLYFYLMPCSYIDHNPMRTFCIDFNEL